MYCLTIKHWHNNDSTNNNWFVCEFFNNKLMDLTINKITEKIKIKPEYILIIQTVLVTVNRGGWLFWHFIEYNIKTY